MNYDYKTYKNGVYGLKYKKYYIIPTEDGRCQIINDKAYIIVEAIENRKEAVWEIEKRTASEQEKKVLEFLYKKTIPELTTLMMEYYGKNEPDEKYIYKMAEFIRDRKDEGKEW